MKKAELREYVKGLRRTLAEEEIKARSAEITEALFSLEVMNNADTVMVYISAFKEVDTRGIIEKLSAAHRKIVVPVSNTANCTITPSYIDGMSGLKKGAYGILEPVNIREAELSDIDVMLVPGIVFDERCSRCGFGKGYYDRLLDGCGAVKIGLCYDFQVVKEIETDANDIPMDMVVTERRIINAV
ncbi:MAG: 5-formyltetrahydrofolate cyclo-ligase [bacterium]|nr:5-formyltetrahydrofolate cyclo-ligase [bacterium]